jgi:CheY-like chemotaxis protein
MDAVPTSWQRQGMTFTEPGLPASNCPAHILLVEDNPVIAMNTEALLEELGAREIVSTPGVADALRLIDDRTFDFAILDLKLGNGEDSLPVAERLAEAGVPYVFATGFNEEDGLPPNHGARAILKKPYSFEDLARAICS